jgi:hypothetical protein
MLDKLLNGLLSQWHVLKRAPIPFLLAGGLGVALTWTVSDWAYKRQLDILHEHLLTISEQLKTQEHVTAIKDAELTLERYRLTLARSTDQQLQGEIKRVVQQLRQKRSAESPLTTPAPLTTISPEDASLALGAEIKQRRPKERTVIVRGIDRNALAAQLEELSTWLAHRNRPEAKRKS